MGQIRGIQDAGSGKQEEQKRIINHMGIFKKISQAISNRTTYRVGLLQAKAYRILKRRTGEVLEPIGISTVEWAFLGLIYERETIQPKIASQELGVEAPFITEIVSKLSKKKLVLETQDEKDRRYKSLSLTAEGKNFVESHERMVRDHMRPLVSGASAKDLLGYISVLETIVANSQNDI
jgi:DNA-binding MarR family transcriptional regulator